MASGGTNLQQAKATATRRKWLPFEEDAMLSVLDDFDARGQRCENETFKSGTLLQMEEAMPRLCPDSDLKAYPHIESKLKKWKEYYSIVYDLSNTSGFAWNDNRKCIEVDSNDAWDTYVQHNKSAKGWRNKTYPVYDRLAAIFGKDRANEKGAEVSADMADVQSNNETNLEHVVNENLSPTSQTQESSQSEGTRKRKRVDDGDKLIVALSKVFEDSGKKMQMVTEAILKGNEDRSDIAK